ncbi:hypothetical protein FBT96_05995 [Rhodobacter capsulatus]|uniref:Uncharacterized protein n=1 Tax=Rhodobacter capsulatus TaxID=1061 RepID=A0A4U1JW87_RHOCA|nr:hypothetical protein [Rhodobacter capsulatus]TKD22668.1 hypothetical protein FBT96_05995 [Rhodobacter capsulatus]
MTALPRLLVALGCALGLLWAAAAPGIASDLPYAGGCELTRDGGVYYRGTCAIRRAPIPADPACTGELISLQIPGRGGADLLRGTGPGCASDFLGSPVTFIAEDVQGWLVVTTEAGKIFRFDPGPDPALPVLDAVLAGIDRCAPAPQARAFTESLRARFPQAASAPEGPLASDGLPLPWPPGGWLAPEQLSAQKRGAELQIELQLDGSYLGLPLARLRTSFGPDGALRMQELVFAVPRARLGAARDLAEQPPKPAPGGPDLAPGEPGRLICRFAR